MSTVSLGRRSCPFPVICIVVFLGAAVTVVPFVNRSGLTAFDVSGVTSLVVWLSASLVVSLAMCLLLLLGQSTTRRRWITYLIPVGLLAVGIGRATNFYGSGSLKQYGDYGALRIHLSEPETENSRWLLGLTLLREGFRAVNEVLTILGVLDDGDIDPQMFVQIATALVMSLWAIWLLKSHEASVVPWIVTTAPMWILFSVGYDEYYPLVAGLIIAAIWNVLRETPIFGRTTSYVIVGLLPILYVGAFPLSVALLISCWGRDTERRERIRGTMTALVTAVLSIEVGGEFRGYFVRLSENLNVGGKFLDQELAAKGVDASSGSIFGNLSYVISIGHSVDIFFWLSCGAGLLVVFLPLLLSRKSTNLSIRNALTRSFRSKRSGSVRLNSISKLILLISALTFLVFMLPLLGITRDIDLYFISLFTFLLVSGTRLDELIRGSENSAVLQLQVMQLVTFGFAPVTTALVFFGVSR